MNIDKLGTKEKAQHRDLNLNGWKSSLGSNQGLTDYVLVMNP